MIILASASPRRRELLRLITSDFRVIASDADEVVSASQPPQKVVEELAMRKARAVAALHPGDIVIGADTVVWADGRLLGKPGTPAEATGMLKMLSGRQHFVYTGVAIFSPGGSVVFSEETGVAFTTLTDAQIARYVAGGEPFDKAGGYAIQGKGALFVTAITGDYYNVVGLPVCRLAQMLDKIENLNG